MKKGIATILMLALMMGITGCKENPDESIVKNKDLDNLIDEASNTENGGQEMEGYGADAEIINAERAKLDSLLAAYETAPDEITLTQFPTDNSYKSVFLQNNDNYGNCLRYRNSTIGYVASKGA